MKRWYKSAFCKGILVLLAGASVAVMSVCLAIGLAYPGQNYEELFTKKTERSYEDTRGFSKQVSNETRELLAFLESKSILEKDGKKDLTQSVTVENLRNIGELKKGEGEFSFHLEDLLDRVEGEENELVVGKREDGTYHYMGFPEFIRESRQNAYLFPNEAETKKQQEEALKTMEEGIYLPDGKILDKDGKTVYKEVWFYNEPFDTTIKTTEGKTMVELANTSEMFNGSLEQMQEALDAMKSRVSSLKEAYDTYEPSFSQGNTNLSYLYVDYDKKQLETNRNITWDNVESEMHEMTKTGKYVVVSPKLADCSTNMSKEGIALSDWQHMVKSSLNYPEKFQLIVSVNTDYMIQDSFYNWAESYEKYSPYMDNAIVIGVGATIILLLSIIWLTAVSGRSNQCEELELTRFDKWKTEIWLCLIGCLGTPIVMEIVMAIEYYLYQINNYAESWNAEPLRSGRITVATFMGIGAGTFVAGMLFLIAYLSFVRRIKARNLWKGSICRWFLQSVAYIYRNRSSITKIVIIGSGMLIINLLMTSNSGFFILLGIAVDVYMVIKIAQRSIEKEKIKKGIMCIANGDAKYKISLKNLSKDNQEMAMQVNRIGEGIQNAVEKSLKDERLKTDLITNVSHDIKTPLTSIINYVGLLKQEKFDDPKVQRYLDILDAKSQRLKTLTEDVVEASKISSGNINLEFINLNLVEMIHQTTGEFAEKFEKKDLKAVVNVPEEPVIVRVDGRRMWRVIENIYNNAAKYAMPSTRIYVDVVANGKIVVLSLKNVSEYPLNITADELTERFIRGDVSRSTEGSGLGLSIAKNLTEMQGGKFKIYIDGDLFKVTITFPQMQPTVTKQEEM